MELPLVKKGIDTLNGKEIYAADPNDKYVKMCNLIEKRCLAIEKVSFVKLILIYFLDYYVHCTQGLCLKSFTLLLN